MNLQSAQKKQPNRKIVETLCSLFKGDICQIVHVLWYGSRKDDADIDLLIVTGSQTHWDQCCLGRLDLACLPLEQFKDMAFKLDPLVIEPLFSGEVLIGNDCDIKEMKAEVSSRTPTPEDITYLSHRSLAEYLKTISLLSHYKNSGEQSHLLWALVNLSFAFSYRLLADLYEKELWNGPLLLKHILESGSPIEVESLFQTLHNEKRDPSILNDSLITSYVENWRHCFLK